MPRVIIDNMALEVAAGTKVIDAAEEIGIMIPRFCYLKALGAVGACRMCAVHFLSGPVKGIEMSCMVEAKDGMVISTVDREATDFRRQVIEWLMANHPHDCPVCDEGGQCLLQDETVSGGHGNRRYPGRKRTYHDQYLGVFVRQEMNRCIHCYRCARFYQEYAGGRDFGVMQIGNRIFYGRFHDGPLESPFSGNLVDICPTGVFTDIPARYKARHWDMQRAPSLCIHCSLGCNTMGSAYHQAIIRHEARENNEINGPFICDRGRFGCFYANLDERPWQPRVDGQEAGWEQAMTAAADGLQRIISASGHGAVAVLGSTRASQETLVMLDRCCTKLGLAAPCCFYDPALEGKVRRAVHRLDERLATSLHDIENADHILVVGVDPVNEAPMLALALRQAVRKGAEVTVLDPRPLALPFAFSHLPVAPGELAHHLALLSQEAVDRQTAAGLGAAALAFYEMLCSHTPAAGIAGQIAEAAGQLAKSRRPVLVCGTETVREYIPDLVADLAELLHGAKGSCGLFYVLPGANAHGAAQLAKSASSSFPEILAGIENGSIKAVLAVEGDPFFSFPDRQRLEKALGRLDLLVVLDYLPTAMTAQARILCPTSTHFETGSTFVNQEGRVQFAHAVHNSARPLAQISGGTHPPRRYDQSPGPDGPKPAWQMLTDLTAAMLAEKSGPAAAEAEQLIDAWQDAMPGLRQMAYPVDGHRLVPAAGEPTYHLPADGLQPEPEQGEELELVLTAWHFGTEELSSCSDPVRQAENEPYLAVHAEEAARAGLADGDTVMLHLDHGSVQLTLKTFTSMARRVAVIPRHRRIAWQQLQYRREKPLLCRVEKA